MMKYVLLLIVGVFIVLIAAVIGYPNNFQWVELNLWDYTVRMSFWGFLLLFFVLCWSIVFVLWGVYFLCKMVLRGSQVRGKNRRIKQHAYFARLLVCIQDNDLHAALIALNKINETADSYKVFLLLNACDEFLKKQWFECAQKVLSKIQIHVKHEMYVWFLFKKATLFFTNGQKNDLKDLVNEMESLPTKENVLFERQIIIFYARILNEEYGECTTQLTSKSFINSILDKRFKHTADTRKKCFINLWLRLLQEDAFEQLSELVKVFNGLPSTLRYDNDLFLPTVDYLDDYSNVESLYWAHDVLLGALNYKVCDVWLIRFSNLKLEMHEQHFNRYEKWLKNKTIQPDLWVGLAQIAIRSNRLDYAFNVLQEILSVDPSHKRTHYLLGIYFQRKKKYLESCESFSHASSYFISLVI